jgi:hypothetical protein
MKRYLWLIFLAVPAFADFNKDARGTTTANFLKLGVDARAVGMGEAYSALTADAASLYWNPAGLARIEDKSATFMHAPYLESSFFDYGAYGQRIGRHGFGGAVQFFSAGSINQTDENNNPQGSFTPHDLAFSLGYAYRLGDDNAPSVGVVGKYIQSKIIDTAQTMAVDVGVQSRLYAEKLRFAFTAVNMGGKMKFEEESESIPMALRLGSAYQIKRNWNAAFDLAFPKDNQPYVALGTEYVWHPSGALDLAGRLGYNSRTSGDIDGLTGVSMGFGLGFSQRFSFDYAFLPYGSLGLSHRISLSFAFGAVKDKNASTIRRPNYDEYE